MGGTPGWSRAECEDPAPEGEGAAETVCDGLTPAPVARSLSPCTVGGKGGRKIWSEVKSGKKGGVGGRCFYCSLPCSDLIGNKLNSFLQVESVLPVTVIAE